MARMPTFTYLARDSSGGAVRGTDNAAGADLLAARLRQQGLLVLHVSAAGVNPPRPPLRLNPLAWLPPSRLDVEVGIQQLGTMLHSGLTLLAALKTVGEQSGRPRTAAMWKQVREQIEQGASLSGALTAHPSQFSQYVVQLVRVGEHSGELDRMIARAAEHLEQTRNNRLMVVNALAYPALVALMAIGVATFLVLSIIPKVERFLVSRGHTLPHLTQMLLDVSAWIRHYLPHIGIGIAVIVVAIWAIHRWPPGRHVLHAALLRVPIVGSVLRLAGTASFSRGLGILIESGVSLLDSLQTAERLVGNLALSRQVAAARAAVIRGARLADALEGRHGFLPMMSRMIAVGEETGTLGRALSDSARFHETQLLATIRRLSVLIEPVTILVVGGMVGFVYVAFFVALFSIAQAVR